MDNSGTNEYTRQLNSNLNMPSLCIEKSEMAKQQFLQSIINNLKAEIFDYKTSLKIHKEIVHNLLVVTPDSQNQVIQSIFNEMLRVKEEFQDLTEEKQSLEAK